MEGNDEFEEEDNALKANLSIRLFTFLLLITLTLRFFSGPLGSWIVFFVSVGIFPLKY